MAGFGFITLLLFAYLSGKNGKPVLHAAVYTVVSLVMTAFRGEFVFKAALIAGVIVFVYCSLYFWLVERFADNVFLYFVILLSGVVLWIAWPFLLV